MAWATQVAAAARSGQVPTCSSDCRIPPPIGPVFTSCDGRGIDGGVTAPFVSSRGGGGGGPRTVREAAHVGGRAAHFHKAGGGGGSEAARSPLIGASRHRTAERRARE